METAAMQESRTFILTILATTILLAALMICPGFCGEGNPPQPGLSDADRQRASQVLQKLLSAQPLTDEERGVADQIKEHLNRQAAAGPVGADQPPAGDPAVQAVLKLLNGQALNPEEKTMAERFTDRLKAPAAGVELPMPPGVDRQRAMEIMQKVRTGQPLTDEEKALAAQFQERMRTRRGQGPDQPAFRTPGEPGLVWADDRMNVVDLARLEMARLHTKNQRYQEAVAVLATILVQSPDKLAVAAAHLDLGTIYRRNLKDTDKAIEEYGKVEGELCVDAAQQIAATYQETGRWEEAVEAINTMNAKADRQSQVQLLRQQAELYARNGQDDKAIETLKRIPNLVTYPEAQEWREEGAAVPMRRPLEMMQRPGPRGDMGQNPPAAPLVPPAAPPADNRAP